MVSPTPSYHPPNPCVFQNRGFPLRDASGHILRWCVLLTDIDDRKRAEEALAASERNLKLLVDTINDAGRRQITLLNASAAEARSGS
jgi:PAS domain-containing protein